MMTTESNPYDLGKVFQDTIGGYSNLMGPVVLLECAVSRGTHSFTIQQIGEELNRTGRTPVLINLSPGGIAMPFDVLKDVLEENQPSLIIWDGPGAYRHWPVIKQFKCRKVNTWFDEPFMRVDGFKVRNELIESLRFNVHHFCWDQFWANKMMTEYNLMADLIHLAASPEEYYPCEVPLSDDIVFIGNLHSPRDLYHRVDALNPLFRSIAMDCIYEAGRSDYGKIGSWMDQLEASFKKLSDAQKRLYLDLMSSMDHDLYNLRYCVWTNAKNEVRKRILKRALKHGRLVIYTEMEQLMHANEAELRSMLECWGERLVVVNTARAQTKHLCQIYHHGKIHIQATDPQSMTHGIPYRVFQTLAAGRPLLTDDKPGWQECFTDGADYLVYKDEDDFEQKLKLLLDDDKLRAHLSTHGRETFEAKHTWEHRLAQMKGNL